NIGIEYQQKISALFLLLMYMGNDVSRIIRGLKQCYKISEIRFETDSSIDDLNLICDNGYIYIQIKHSISMSNAVDSELFSVLDQFAIQSMKKERKEEYLIITSNKASRKVRVELNKIIDSIRLNEISYAMNP